MTPHKIYWTVRDTLAYLGLVRRKRFGLRRQEPGACRMRLTGRGSSRRLRRIPLSRLLSYQA